MSKKTKKNKIRSVIIFRTLCYGFAALATFLILPYIFHPLANYLFPVKQPPIQPPIVKDIVLEPFEERLVLIGDAGNMNRNVSQVLAEFIKVKPKDTSIVYMGDNIYSRGIPREDDPMEYNKAVERLYRQIDPFKGITGKIFFIPGNHDWDMHDKDGWNAVKRQEVLVNKKLGEGHFLPSGGCPGPEVLNVSPKLRVIILDTHWWTHKWEKPSTDQDGCKFYTKEAVLEELERLLSEKHPGVTTITAQHHPLVGYGMHALRAGCPADMGCPEYKDMKDRMLEVLDRHPPSLCAAGHDHGHQLLQSNIGCKLDIVTGGGSEVQRVETGKGTLFAKDTLGFALLDRLKDNSWILTIVDVPKNGIEGTDRKWTLAYTIKLEQ